MSWSYRRERTLGDLPVPAERQGWWSDAVAYVANLPLLGTLLALLVLGVVAVVVGFFIVLYVLLGPVPIPKELPSATAATTKVFAGDGSLIAQFHQAINRDPVPLDQMSNYLPKAVVAEEDARFYSDPGVDLRSVLRAAVTDVEAGKILEGGSTITQQYVKVAYVGNKPSLSRKLLEARVALMLTRSLTRDQIMERYLNTVYFGDGAYGAEAAAETYFGEHASQLTLSQAAMLAGIIHSPDVDAPTTSMAKADADRVRVLGRMQKLGMVTADQASLARGDHPSLSTPAAANPAFAWYLDALRTDLLDSYGSSTVYSGGLQVHTTLDPAMQAAAEQAIDKILPNPADPSAALVAIDPATGYVKAIVGGKNYDTSQFNIATLARRQPGSSFKPFVLAAALEDGISLNSVWAGPSRLCPKGWIPGCVTNFGGESFGSISLLNATVNSVNTVYAQLILKVGPQAVVGVANKMGIPGPADLLPPQAGCRPLGSPVCGTYLPAVPSLALGSASVTPLEMASAYATLADGGVYHAPRLASSITDSSGKALSSGPADPVQALPTDIVDQVTQALTQVIVRGTGTAANIGQPAAGKTGTAQNFDNAWFVGYVPNLAAAVWVGDESSDQPLLNVEGVKQVSGGTLPAKIWSQYMQVSLDTTPPTLAVSTGLAAGTVTNQRSPAFTGSAADATGNVVGVQVSVDGGAFVSATVTCKGCPGRSATWSYKPASPLPDGAHTLAIRSVDIAGRTSAVASIPLRVDTVPPVLATLAAAGGAGDVTVTFSKPLACASLNPSSFAVSVQGRGDPVAGVACGSPSAASVELSLAVPPRGGDRVNVTVLQPYRGGVTDIAGNLLASPRTTMTAATNVAPTLSVTGGLANNALTNQVHPSYQGSAADPDGNVTAVQASVDGGPFSTAGSCRGCYNGAPTGSPVDWQWTSPQHLADGTHTVALQAVDNAGAASAPVTMTVTVDTVAPVTTGLAATGGSPQVTLDFSKPMVCASLGPAFFSVTVGNRSSSVTGVACGTTTSTAATLTLSVPPRGGDSVAVTVQAPYSGGPMDLAGNHIGPPHAATVVATNVAPAISVTGGLAAGELTNNRFPSYQGSATDPDGSVTGIQASVDGGPFRGGGVACADCLSPPSVGNPAGWTWRSPLPLADGQHMVVLRSADNAGAMSGAVTETLTVDTVAPKPVGVTAAGGSPVVVLTFTKPLVCSSVAAGAFTVLIGTQPGTVQDATCGVTATAAAASGAVHAAPTGTAVALTLQAPPEGGDRLTVLVGSGPTDAAGNGVANPRVSVAAANTAPSIGFGDTVPTSTATSLTRPLLQGTATDPDGSVVQIEASVDGSGFGSGSVSCTGCGPTGPAATPVSWTWHPPGLGNGHHTLVLKAVDNAGASSPEITQTVLVDASTPTLTGVVAETGVGFVGVEFSKPIACPSVTIGDFTVKVAGSPAPVDLFTCTGDTQAVVDLGVEATPAAGDSVTVTLARGITDDAGQAVRLPASASTTATDTPAAIP